MGAVLKVEKANFRGTTKCVFFEVFKGAAKVQVNTNKCQF